MLCRLHPVHLMADSPFGSSHCAGRPVHVPWMLQESVAGKMSCALKLLASTTSLHAIWVWLVHGQDWLTDFASMQRITCLTKSGPQMCHMGPTAAFLCSHVPGSFPRYYAVSCRQLLAVCNFAGDADGDAAFFLKLAAQVYLLRQCSAIASVHALG